ncbi:MAG: SprT-like domain-containing protein [Flammeovirgaceae bacterium]|nr:SprT-like domain-containing protein [Flammeovirgaceae bacterium]
MDLQKVKELLQDRIPTLALAYCLNLWQENPFDLKLTKSRQTKVGDFTVRRSMNRPRITLNHDLNCFLFLTTFIHEVAHHRTVLQFGLRTEPHGEEWKLVYQNLMAPLLNDGSVFPEGLLNILRVHMQSPKASSFADVELTKAFRKFDRNHAFQTTLAELPEGTVFRLQGRFFKKGTTQRTRVLCYEMKTRKKYLVPAEAIVGEAQLSLL